MAALALDPVVNCDSLDRTDLATSKDGKNDGGASISVNTGGLTDDGLALMDTPNITCTLFRMGRLRLGPVTAGGLDLLVLKRYLAARGFTTLLCVHRRWREQTCWSIAQRVKAAGWKYISVDQCRYGQDARDPVDDYIRQRIQDAAGKQRQLALFSHDGGYKRSLCTYLRAGGHVLLGGFVEHFSRRLYRLTYESEELGGQATLSDLMYDARAIYVHKRDEVPEIPANEMKDGGAAVSAG